MKLNILPPALFTLLATCFAMCFASCADCDETVILQRGIAINNINITTDTNLAARPDWELLVENKSYEYAIKGENMVAVPTKEPARYHSKYTEGDQLDPDFRIKMMFASPEYRQSLSAENPSTTLMQLFADQSTIEKMNNLDMLECGYQGTVNQQIENAIFTHANALFEIRMPNLAATATTATNLYILQNSVKIRPFTANDMNLQCITYADSEKHEAYAVWQIGDEEYQAQIGEDVIRKNLIYSFELRFDEDRKKLIVIGLTTRGWLR